MPLQAWGENSSPPLPAPGYCMVPIGFPLSPTHVFVDAYLLLDSPQIT